jgi:hypothetical protein
MDRDLCGALGAHEQACPRMTKPPKPKGVTQAEVIERVLARIEAGESERSACEAEKINRATFRSAALRHQAADHYARALEALAMDQIEKLETAIQEMRDGSLDPQVGRIEVDARKWFASKFLPKRFGEKLTQEHTGPDGGPIQSQTRVDVSGMTEEQLRVLASVPVHRG